MPFRIELNHVLKQKLKKAMDELILNAGAKLFWGDLKNVFKLLSRNATEFGEPVYEFKHVKFQSRVGIRWHFGIQFAVSDEHQTVFIQRLTLGENHPYPIEFEEILNHEPF